MNSGSNPNRPKAYLNYVLFDEDMRIVGTMAGAFQANGNGSGNWTTIGTEEGDDLVMPANGYLAVYLSNKTASTCIPCADVYFDLLTVRFTRGNLLEETHYYPHGLPIYGLSGRTATGFQDNRRKYQSKEYIKDLGLNWMDFHARQYDPQIGRFLGVDPMADGGGQQVWSPYAAMGNAPESMVDPDGMKTTPGGTLDFRTKNTLDMIIASDWRGGWWSPFLDGGAPEAMARGIFGSWDMGASFVVTDNFSAMAQAGQSKTSGRTGSISAGELYGSFGATSASSDEDEAIADPDPQDNKKKETSDKEGKKEDSQQSYVPPPKNGLPGFPDAGKGGHSKSGRWRWIDKNGDILEWDKQHGEVEKYDKTGKNHKGAFDPKTGLQLKPGIEKRKTSKFVSTLPIYSPTYFTRSLTIGIGITSFISGVGRSIKDWWNTPSIPCNCE